MSGSLKWFLLKIRGGGSLLSTLNFVPSQDFPACTSLGGLLFYWGQSLPGTLRMRKATTDLRAVHMKDQSDLSNGLVYWSSS